MSELASIKVLEIKNIHNGNLREVRKRTTGRKAFVSLKIGETVFHDFRIVQQPGQRAWVSAPVSSWRDETGRMRYKTLIELPPKLKKAITEAVLNAWEGGWNAKLTH